MTRSTCSCCGAVDGCSCSFCGDCGNCMMHAPGCTCKPDVPPPDDENEEDDEEEA